MVQWTLAYLALAYVAAPAELLGSSLGWSHSLLRLFTMLLILGVPVVVIVSWYHGARALRRVSGTELTIIAILLAIGGTLLWRDSKTERVAEREASAVGEHGKETGRRNQPRRRLRHRRIRRGTGLFGPLCRGKSRLFLGRDRGGITYSPTSTGSK